MHDLQFFRANLDAVAARLATRGFKLDVEQVRALDTERRAALTEAERLKTERNAASQEIAKLRKEGQDTCRSTSAGARDRRADLLSRRARQGSR